MSEAIKQPVSPEGIIQMQGVNKWYGQFHVLKDINLNVKQGERIVLCGPSGSGKSTTIRCLNRLEEHLGTRLLQRTTRQLKLTAVGERYLRHCQAMLLEAEMADEAVASMSSEPRGRLRMSCPVGLAHEFLPSVISTFLERFPQVQLEMTLVNRRVDLVAEGIDVALRVRELGDEDPLLVTKRLRCDSAEAVSGGRSKVVVSTLPWVITHTSALLPPRCIDVMPLSPWARRASPPGNTLPACTLNH